ncbi:hypothetical protein F8271_17590 [Micromonospora sp. ALFpr18c]|uniref:hypothetical protein n=1 Tax=unclassified Micromonospora TaxID=2617518 RepID=UPI00124B5538|nr:hypothetical protein [Micromonospora sp. ALFpr18c]KAB1938973.1 hypothetical protein F8271_17590 [Micromonospora sp. ALFpr18c]
MVFLSSLTWARVRRRGDESATASLPRALIEGNAVVASEGKEPRPVTSERSAPRSRDPADDPRHEVERRMEQRLDALERLIDAKLAHVNTKIDAQAAQVGLALASADKAVTKSETATEKRFESVNEFRQALSDQTKTFIARVEFEVVRDSHAGLITDLASRMDKLEGKGVGLNAGWVYLVGGLTVVATVVGLVLAFA